MTDREMVLDLLSKNNGVIETKQIVEKGIDNKILQRLQQEGSIERIGRGIYVDADQMADNYLISQYRCRKGIYSHETALFLHDLCDRTPLQLMMTIPTGYNTRLLKNRQHYQFFYIKKELHEIGQVKCLSPYGNTIVVYDKERTICDCLRKKNKLDTDLVLTAVKHYMGDPDRDLIKLQKYADFFKMRETVHQYMEVLS